MKSITRFITHKLKLKVNEAKSAVARPQERKFLGFSFTAGPEVKRVPAPKALDRFKRRIREITRQAKGVSIKTTIAIGTRSHPGAASFKSLYQKRPPQILMRLRIFSSAVASDTTLGLIRTDRKDFTHILG